MALHRELLPAGHCARARSDSEYQTIEVKDVTQKNSSRTIAWTAISHGSFLSLENIDSKSEPVSLKRALESSGLVVAENKFQRN